ncbi:hypothetical protein Riv7116_3802 [Rivularia sp. PCC 7116]|nr:hypothetical protein Riv7116_3802 [Rivularia sp. PCC 7116]
MFYKLIAGVSYLTFSCLLISCGESVDSFTRKDCQNGIGYDGYLKGYFTAKNYLQRKPINFNNVYDYCYTQGYIDAS